jgi:hypothetical protein
MLYLSIIFGGSTTTDEEHGVEPTATAGRRECDAVVVGGGISGIAAVVRLRKEAGLEDVVLIERSHRLGGTWNYNSYPGCACDIPSSLYSFEFAPNPDWTRTFAQQPEIRHRLQLRHGPGPARLHGAGDRRHASGRPEAIRRARIHVGQMVANPVSDGITTAHGFAGEVGAIREAMMTGGLDALADAVDERLIDTFSISGTPDECRAKLKNYEGLVPHIMLHPPYMPPLGREETEDAYRNILNTFAR